MTVPLCNRCSVSTSGTCAPRASGSLWCTRSATWCCCWAASRSVSRPRCVSSPAWGPAPRPPSNPSADPWGASGPLCAPSSRSQGEPQHRHLKMNTIDPSQGNGCRDRKPLKFHGHFLTQVFNPLISIISAVERFSRMKPAIQENNFILAR